MPSLLLERERELDAIDSAISRLLAGTGSFVLLEGPAGIGKTSLLSEAVVRARGRGIRVLGARGGELEREVSFGVARELFEPVVAQATDEERARLLTGTAARAAAALGRAEGADFAGDSFAPIHGLYWLLSNLADEGPLVLAIDDAQWADAQTLRFLDYLARRSTDTAALVLAAVRTGEPQEPAEIEALRVAGERVLPSALTSAAVRELIAAEFGAKPEESFSDAFAEATAGNPFLVAELLRGLRAEELDPASAPTVQIAELAPEGVARYVLVRLGRFGEDAIAVARAVAVLGGSPQLRHAAQLAGVTEGSARELCDRLREAEILAPGLPIDFVHPLVRSAIYLDQAEGERSLAHRHAAEVLSAAGAVPRDIAPHLLECQPNGDQWVVGKLSEAAWEAIRAGAFDAAQGYMERALEEPPTDDLPLQYGLGRALLQNDPTRAAEILDEVAERATDEVLRSKALRSAAQGHFVAGSWRESAVRYERLLEALPEEDRDRRLVLEAEHYITKMLGHGRDADLSERIQTVAAGLSGTTPGERLARQALASDRFAAGLPVEETLAPLYPLSEADWGLRANLPAGAAPLLALCGRWDEARQVILGFIRSARDSGLLVNVAYFSSLKSQVERTAGHLPESEADARTAAEMAAAAAASNPAKSGTMNLIMTLVARGHLDAAERTARDIDLSGGMDEVQVSPWPIEVRAALRLARGELEAGAQDWLEFGEQAERRSYQNPAGSPWRAEAATALCALGRTAEAGDLVSVAEERARRFAAAHVIGAVLRARATLEPRKRQVETLRESVSLLEHHGARHELARSLVELGTALRRDRQRSDARDPLRRALDLAHRCGADGLAARASEELAATGARARSVLRTGVSALTASELRTAKLAAEGLSNREIAERLFVTRRTVETQLTQAYSKLEISGRDQLAAALAQDGGDTLQR